MRSPTCRCGAPLSVVKTKKEGILSWRVFLACPACGYNCDVKIGPGTWLRIMFRAMKEMPYKWAWICLFIISAICFSWWDEIAVWAASIVMLNPMIAVVYYVIEYGVMLPIVILLAWKTYKRLGLNFSPGEHVKKALAKSLPVTIYRALRRLVKR